jgi:hypothetical protein
MGKTKGTTNKGRKFNPKGLSNGKEKSGTEDKMLFVRREERGWF